MEKKGESESTTSFLTALSTWHKEELDEKLANKVQVSQRAVEKIIQVFDHLLQRNEKISKALRGEKSVKQTENDVDGSLRLTLRQERTRRTMWPLLTRL